MKIMCKGLNISAFDARCFIRTHMLPEAAPGVSHESHDDALDERRSHGDAQRSDTDLFAHLHL